MEYDLISCAQLFGRGLIVKYIDRYIHILLAISAPMDCPRCALHQPSRQWTDAQWKQRRPDVGFRFFCKACYDKGPTTADWNEVRHRALEMHKLSYQNLRFEYENFMVALVKAVPKRKDRRNGPDRAGCL